MKFGRNFIGLAALYIKEAAHDRFPFKDMVTLLEYIGFVALVVVSLGGFVTAIAWGCAIWFGERN